MESSEIELKKKLKEMAMLSLLGDRLSETHIKNIQSYPFIFFDGVLSVKIEYDLSKGDPKEKNHKTSMNYMLSIKDSAENSNLNKRCQTLAASVKNLLWNDIDITIAINGNIIEYRAK